MRPHVAAVYAFARVADDIADEGDGDRRRAAGAAAGLAAAAARCGRGPIAAETRLERDDDLVFVALGHSIRSLDLPVSLFDDLLSAFGQDTMTTRYASWGDVLDYCRRSANPVGRLVLRIAGYRDDALDRSSDALCTALQLTNFWQDFGRDWRAGRLYVPREVQDALRRARGPSSAAPCCRRSGRARSSACVDVTRARVTPKAARVCDGVARPAALELRLTWLGGRRILDRVDAPRAVCSQHRPALGAADVPPLLWRRLDVEGRRGLMARKTSFYYAFLVLPAEQRRAIIAVWDFCRAVDDAVDEAGNGSETQAAREAVCFWRAELARCFDGGVPQTPQGRRLQPFIARFDLPRRGVRRRDRRRGDGSRHDALSDLRRSVRVLPPRRVGGRPDLHQDLRLPRSDGRATTR